MLAHEALIARGQARDAARLGHRVDRVTCSVTIDDVAIDQAGTTATVQAHVVSLARWHDTKGRANVEGSGVDHVVTLRFTGAGWLVTGDAYSDDLTARFLEAAGASGAQVRAAARNIEAQASTLAPPPPPASLPGVSPVNSNLAAPLLGAYPRTTLYFDRRAAAAYADKYALNYNSTYVRFSGADCANFGSQTMFAGGYPKVPGTYESGWWYDKEGTSSPGDDTYSHSWIAVIYQRAAWGGLYTDAQSSISAVGKGDFVYYDWSGDGRWDHVAELVGTNSAGQKVIDAHTTDHYRVYWKLGSSTTRYAFARTRNYIYVY